MNILSRFLACGGVVGAVSTTAGAIVINEIHYNPDVKTDAVEFIELHNPGPAAVDLAGWSLFAGSGLQFTFPSTNLAAGGYVVVGQNPAAVQTKFAVSGVLGPFNAGRFSALSKYGEKIELRDAGGTLQDEVEYQLGFPWPTVGDPPGYSIELIHPSLDNNLGGSWRSSFKSAAVHGPTPGRINSVYATNAPPQIRQVDHHPTQPVSGQTVRITAKVTDPDGVAGVTLQYQVVLPGSYIERNDAAYTNDANWVSVPMTDDGAGADVTASDAIYSAFIPASVQQHRRLVRYRISVADNLGASVRVPYADDPQPNFAYFVYDGVPGWRGAVQPGAAGANGVVQTFSSNVMGRLPVYHLIARSNTVATATWFSRYTGDLYQWWGTLVYDDKVYDHVRYRARGGVWRYSMCKNMWKFDMNRGHDFEPRDNWGHRYQTPWTKLNLGANIQQGDYNHRGEQGMFESLGFRLFQLAGVAAPNTAFVTFRVIDDAQEASPTTQYEGDFWGLYLAIEQEDSRFLQEHDLPDGNFYKMEGGTGELNNLGAAGPSNKSDLNAFLGAYNSVTNASLPDTWWRTNLHLPKYYGYQIVVQSIHHYDIADGKNYFYLRNPFNNQWEVCTWDLDLTWADNMYRAGQQGGDEPFKGRVLSNFSIPGTRPVLGTEFRNRVREWRDLLWNSDQAFRLLDEYAALVRGPTNGPTILDADRAMWDYNPKMVSSVYTDQPSSKAGQGRFYQFPNEPTVSKNFNGAIQLMKNYVGYRATNTAFSLDTMSVDNARPTRPTLTYTGPENYPLNRLTFRSSSFAGSSAFAAIRWRIAEVTPPDRVGPDAPSQYEIQSVWDSGPLTTFNADCTIPANVPRIGSRYRVRVLHTDANGRNSNWSLPHEFTCGEPENLADLLNYLRITEVMFNPLPSGYEYVELHNTSASVTLDLSGVKFTQGIDFTCLPGTTLPPGGYLLIIGTTDVAAFRAYYGLDDSVSILAAFDGGLSNGGEQLVLRTSAGGTDIVRFTYGDGRGWPPQADGAGHSLVLENSALGAEGTGAGEYGGNWRASTFLRGSPGRSEPPLPPGPLLNEVAAHTDFTGEFDSNDWIELYNPTDSPLVLGTGWYLSDDGSSLANLMKWAIPSSTIIPARGFVTFDEVTGFHNPTNIGFGLSKSGEQVFLSYLPGNAQDRIVDAVSFKGQENGWALGRYPDGGPFWYALTPRTRNANNAPPASHIAISEILYHPPDDLSGTNVLDNALDEFIEITSPESAGTITLMTNAAGPWRLDGGVSYLFPADMQIAGGEHILIVNFDPVTNATQLAEFQSRYGIADGSVRILGPYGGKLANNSDRVALERPQPGELPGDSPSWVVVDEVIYADQAPWPCGTDGSGNSLQRLDLVQHGCDPLNWSAEPPTAGRPRANLPPGLPAITDPPHNLVVATNADASFSVSVCGTPPFTYQWQFNNQPISGATNATYTRENAQPSHAGQYRVVVSNAAGSVTSDPATLIVQFPPVILVQPQPVTAVRDQSASFSVQAGGTAPFTYQWRFNGLTIPGATNNVLTLSNVQTNQAGGYTAVVLNMAGAVASSSATLTVLIPATIVVPPTNRIQTVTINTNGFFYNPTNVTFVATAIGTGTLNYQWRFNDVDIPGATGPSLTLVNVTPAQEGTYTLNVHDSIGPTSASATLTVLVPPVFAIRPTPQSIVEGGNVTFSAVVYGYPLPFTNDWRRGSTVVRSETVYQNLTFLSLTNVQTNQAGSYNLVVRTRATPLGIGSGQAPLTVLIDSDHDGLPDEWEALYFGAPNVADPDADSDGDSQSNRAEYIAGTDPTDPSSYLKVDEARPDVASNLWVRIEFQAVSNRTYTVQSSDKVPGGSWSKVSDLPATTTNRPVVIYDSRPATNATRFYRLRTPKEN
ncbi:MAG TPA: lamin tail domain-containing protein [Verrucomicrobiae bacterium]|nr:lamin tail domain-containing protein [Verrucomicrobiae bacterium]